MQRWTKTVLWNRCSWPLNGVGDDGTKRHVDDVVALLKKSLLHLQNVCSQAFQLSYCLSLSLCLSHQSVPATSLCSCSLSLSCFSPRNRVIVSIKIFYFRLAFLLDRISLLFLLRFAFSFFLALHNSRFTFDWSFCFSLRRHEVRVATELWTMKPASSTNVVLLASEESFSWCWGLGNALEIPRISEFAARCRTSGSLNFFPLKLFHSNNKSLIFEWINFGLLFLDDFGWSLFLTCTSVL